MEDITPSKDLERIRAKYTKELEVKVSQRTKDLTNRIKELELLNKSMVGRELKMIELKNEISALERKTKKGNGKKI